MRFTYLILILGLIVSSCKKDQDLPETKSTSLSTKKYPISFTASGFNQSVTDYSKSKGNSVSSNLRDYVEELFYVVFDSTGTEIRRVNQGSINSEFGLIKDSLASGNYTVVIIASQQPFAINHWNDDQTFTYPLGKAFFHYDHSNAEYTTPKTKDTFYKKFNITVASSPINDIVILDRVVGKIQIKISDEKVNGDYRLWFPNETTGLYLETGSSDGGIEVNDFSQAEQNIVPGEARTFYILNTNTPMDVILVYRETHENGLIEDVRKVIKNVRVYKNKKTILTGKMHNSALVYFNIIVNDEFDMETVNMEF